MAEEKKVTVIVSLGGRMEIDVEDSVDPQKVTDFVVSTLGIDLSRLYQPFVVLADNATGEHMPMEEALPLSSFKDSNMLRVVLPLKLEG